MTVIILNCLSAMVFFVLVGFWFSKENFFLGSFQLLAGLCWIVSAVLNSYNFGAKEVVAEQKARAVEVGLGKYTEKGKLIFSDNILYVLSGNVITEK